MEFLIDQNSFFPDRSCTFFTVPNYINFDSVMHEVNNLESSVVVQALELETNLALYGRL